MERRDRLKEIVAAFKESGQWEDEPALQPLLTLAELRATPVWQNFIQFGLHDTIRKIATRRLKDKWHSVWSFLVFYQQTRKHTKNWLIHMAYEIKPPLSIWMEMAKYLGYNEGWAEYSFEKTQKVSSSTPS